MTQNTAHRVVIVGAGFGGLNAARALRKAPVSVTVINGTNHHVFEPLIYQSRPVSCPPARSPPRSATCSARRRTPRSASAGSPTWIPLLAW